MLRRATFQQSSWHVGLIALAALPLTTAAAADDAPYLLALEGPPVTVRYAPGALDRADHVQKRLSRLAAETGHRNLKKPLLVVELLPAEEWHRSGLAAPYGLPAIGRTGALALPAWGDPETVALWRSLLDGWMPSVAGSPVRGTSSEAASVEGADLVGEVEASRIVLARLGLSGSEPWVSDLLACALSISASQRYEPGRWAEVRMLHQRLAVRPEAARDERLERLRWVAAAERIGAETGKLPARPLLKMARKSKGRLSAAKLLERFPWLAEWAPIRRPD